MTYLPITIRPKARTGAVTTLFGKKGMNLRDAPQLLSPDYALDIKNYIITTDGGLIKRQGIEQVFTVAGGNPVTMAQEFTQNIVIFAYNDKVAAYDFTTNAVTTIKTFSGARVCTGDRYGDYFFVTNKVDSLGRISRTLAYDAQTSNFTVGKVLTGGTSGATATILEDADSGGTGTLTLGQITGTFLDNEIITDNNSVPGSATVNGTLTWTWTDVTGAPIGAIVRAGQGRLFLGDLTTDSTAVAYSNQDTGTNPPFTTWTVGSNATDPGLVYDRPAGTVRDIIFLGQNVVVFADFGKWSFFITVLDSGGTIKKVDQTILDRQDFGASKALVTPKGVFYVNEAGLWQLTSLGQPNIPYSEQEHPTSTLLGTKFFNDIDLTNASLVYSATFQSVFVTAARDAAANNYVLGYNVEFKAFYYFTGWRINRFMYSPSQNKIYGFGSQDTTMWECFTGFNDDGEDIFTRYYQELKTGDLETRQVLYGQYAGGFLSASTELLVNFDIYDVRGNFVPAKLSLNWDASSGGSAYDGYGSALWGGSAWGGDVDIAGLIECFTGGRFKIANYQRIRIEITGNDQVAHALTWAKILAEPKAQIRRRTLTKN